MPKIHAKTTRGDGVFDWIKALSNNEVRVFEPTGNFMQRLMAFYWETATPIFIPAHAYKAPTSNGGYSGEGPAAEPYQASETTRKLFFNKLYSKIGSIKKLNSSTGTTSEDDSPIILNADGPVDFSKASTSQRNSLYYTLKNLYDRWISTYPQNQFVLNSPEKEEADKRRRFVGTDDANGVSDDGVESEFNSFLYVDKFYNDISKKFIFNPTKFGQLLEMEFDVATNHSVISFISPP